MRRVVGVPMAVLAAILLSSELSLSMPILGVGPDILVLALVVVVAGQRPITAATYGFAFGLVRDLLLTSPTGLSAFAYAITGYAVAMAGEVRGVWAAIGLTAGATFVSQVLYGFGTLVLSPSSSVSSLPRVAFVSTAYNALLTPLLVPVLRRVVSSGGTSPAGTAVAGD